MYEECCVECCDCCSEIVASGCPPPDMTVSIVVLIVVCVIVIGIPLKDIYLNGRKKNMFESLKKKLGITANAKKIEAIARHLKVKVNLVPEYYKIFKCEDDK